MPSDPAPAVNRRAPSLDHRIESVTGHDLDTVGAHRDRGVLDEPQAQLVDRHRELVQAEAGVTFYRTRLHRLSNGAYALDDALVQRIKRTVGHLAEAARVRDAAAQQVRAALEPLEAAAGTTPATGQEPVSAADRAALCAIAGGAKLYEHLLTGRMSVTAASGTRVPHTQLQRLEGAGLVRLDTSHPLHAGQPVTLTAAGRAALADTRRPDPPPVPKTAARPGAWPSTPVHRH
ncbi:hypothetical protein ABZ820_05035 [Streptomyces diacarni]|uniref:hypothetical protein n=1 Tax=Streptomyces diacarni TaxID=2800381 RepID=UPI0033E9F502